MAGIIFLLYIFLLIVFMGGLVIITYHLLTFRLNPTLAWFMVFFLLTGGIILLVINFLYFSKIDWQEFLSNF